MVSAPSSHRDRDGRDRGRDLHRHGGEWRRRGVLDDACRELEAKTPISPSVPAKREREIGIRMAVGAQPGAVVALVE